MLMSICQDSNKTCMNVCVPAAVDIYTFAQACKHILYASVSSRSLPPHPLFPEPNPSYNLEAVLMKTNHTHSYSLQCLFCAMYDML